MPSKPSPTRRRPPIRDLVRQLRTTAGMSQADLARGAGISRQLMSEIEAGTRGITPQVLRQIAAALGMQATEIDPAATDPAADVKEPLLDVPSVATRIGASRATVYRLLGAGELDRVDIGTGSRPRPRVPESSVAAYIARHLVPGRKTGTKAA